MSKAELTLADDGKVILSGILDFSSVPVLWDELKPLIEQQQVTNLSLQSVDTCNSSALALLVRVKAIAKYDLVISDLPTDLQDLARMSNILPLLHH